MQPKVYCEIGCDKGGSLWAWLTRFPSITHAIVIEIRGCPYYKLFERTFPHVEFLWLAYPSLEVAGSVQKWLGDYRIDVLFIDGDKAHHGFYKDWQAYSPMVRKGGVVFVHDITDMYTDGPGRSWQRIVQTELVRHGDVNRLPEIIDRSEVEPALDKQKRGEPLTSHEEWLCHWKGRSCGVGVVHV